MSIFNIPNTELHTKTVHLLNHKNGKPILPEEIIVMDIETVSGEASFNILQNKNPKLAEQWVKFAKKKFKNEILGAGELYETKSGLFPEYAKIVCISIIFMKPVIVDSNLTFEEKELSFVSENDDEVEILTHFTAVLDSMFRQVESRYRGLFRNIYGQYPQLEIFCHNLKGFDSNMYKNRCVINDICPSTHIYEYGLKPWEIGNVDTLDVWRNGYSYQGDATLATISVVLGIKSPKEDMHGGEVTTYYYSETLSIQEKNEKISTYCEGDNRALKDIINKIQNLTKYSYVQ